MNNFNGFFFKCSCNNIILSNVQRKNIVKMNFEQILQSNGCVRITKNTAQVVFLFHNWYLSVSDASLINKYQQKSHVQVNNPVSCTFKRIATVSSFQRVLILVLSVPSLRLLKTIVVENDLHRTSPNVEHTGICRTRKGKETQANGDFCHLFFAWFRLPVKGTYTICAPIKFYFSIVNV